MGSELKLEKNIFDERDFLSNQNYLLDEFRGLIPLPNPSFLLTLLVWHGLRIDQLCDLDQTPLFLVFWSGWPCGLVWGFHEVPCEVPSRYAVSFLCCLVIFGFL